MLQVANAYKCHLWLDWMQEIAVTIAGIFAELDAHRQILQFARFGVKHQHREIQKKASSSEFEPAFLSAHHAKILRL
ncbi:hypothetical protein AVEN_56615-1 [Araneus ventricosus]|uniref:Uncharacterized protein n=2 Tax=Araneus ventricosus TaxID=182803 RepID=A0A4Y2EW72_ARAVE|nr:hypothetical protein AVEN_56615-1 [Araneus ventricosus]